MLFVTDVEGAVSKNVKASVLGGCTASLPQFGAANSVFSSETFEDARMESCKKRNDCYKTHTIFELTKPLERSNKKMRVPRASLVSML